MILVGGAMPIFRHAKGINSLRTYITSKYEGHQRVKKNDEAIKNMKLLLR